MPPFSINCRRRLGGPLFLLTALMSVASGLGAESTAPRPAAIELPPYTVIETRALPRPEHWLYARAEGFEILSNSSESSTRSLVETLQRLSQALAIVWPGLQRPVEAPTIMIICGRGGKFDEFVPTGASVPVDRARISLALRTREQAAIVIDDEVQELQLQLPGRFGLTRMEADSHQQLSREYIRFLLGNTRAPFPRWFVEGIAQILMTMEISKTVISVGGLEDPQLSQVGAGATAAAGVQSALPEEWDRTFNAALKQRALIPMAQLLDEKAKAAEDERNPLGSTWPKQCAAFVHWGIYGNQRANQKAFVQFVQRSAREPVSEALFKECFKLNFAQMADELRSYVDFTPYKMMEYRAKEGEGLAKLPPLEVRDATEAEVGRIKGDALRMADHQDAARLTMIAAYVRGERDPQLLATLGLQERLMGDSARAKKFLEAAAQGKAVRPRAYLELARIRYDEANAASPDTAFSPTQLEGIVTPLLTAREQPPAIPETYELLAAAWLRAALPPDVPELKIADEGVRRFPRDVNLIYAVAMLMKRAGRVADAAMIIRHGLSVAPNDEARAKLIKLQGSLAP